MTAPDVRVYGVAGWAPGGSARRQQRAARQVEATHRKVLMAERRSELERLRAEQRQRPYLPRAGEVGPKAGRSYRRLTLTPHRATSEVLAGAYPFLAEEGLGAAGMLIGQDAWCWRQPCTVT